MNTIWKISLALSCAAALYAIAIEPSATLIENEDVKITRALEKAHVKGSFHEHKVNRVMVYLQPGTQRFEYQDGRKPVSFNWKVGQVVWSLPEGMHSPEVTSDEPFNIIEVELKKPGTGKVARVSSKEDAVKLDARHYKLEFENDQVLALRLTLAPHESTPMLKTSRKTIAIFLTDQEIRTTEAGGAANTVKHKAGEVVWETPHTLKIENAGDKPLETVLLELSM